MAENEYRHNPHFRAWVDKYCEEHGVTTREALEREEVKRASRYYTDL